MADPILINRYASRRLYNTQTSEYVTLDEIAGLIRGGQDVEIRDRKSGEDLTRQFLLQIITEQESKGENVLPVDVLTGLVRSYSTAAQGMLPDFLSQAWSAFSQQQSAMVEKMSQVPSLPAQWQKQQADMMRQMMAAWMPGASASTPRDSDTSDTEKELADVKAQLAELMRKVDGL
ncbi:MAG: polyhydroxyalkanoate synthesis repressor PhaR [Pseudomonadota bacterium]